MKVHPDPKDSDARDMISRIHSDWEGVLGHKLTATQTNELLNAYNAVVLAEMEREGVQPSGTLRLENGDPMTDADLDKAKQAIREITGAYVAVRENDHFDNDGTNIAQSERKMALHEAWIDFTFADKTGAQNPDLFTTIEQCNAWLARMDRRGMIPRSMTTKALDVVEAPVPLHERDGDHNRLSQAEYIAKHNPTNTVRGGLVVDEVGFQHLVGECQGQVAAIHIETDITTIALENAELAQKIERVLSDNPKLSVEVAYQHCVAMFSGHLKKQLN